MKDLRPLDLISTNIKGYIENRRKFLTCNPQYFIHYGSMTKSKIEEEANRHSVSIELVDYGLTTSESLKLKAQEKHRSEKNIRNARAWAKQYFSLPLTPDYIENIGKLIDPISNPHGFRKGKVRITGARVSPPSAEKIDRELRIFLWENEQLDDGIEKAIHTHFNIGRIHPFDDGNGRTSRLLQDIILHDERLPIAMISLYERPEYIQKIEAAAFSYNEKEANLNLDMTHKLSSLRELASNYKHLSAAEVEKGKYLAKTLLSYRITPEQHAFYDFIALKVLHGLSEELKRLYPSEEEMIKYLKKTKIKNQNRKH